MFLTWIIDLHYLQNKVWFSLWLFSTTERDTDNVAANQQPPWPPSNIHEHSYASVTALEARWLKCLVRGHNGQKTLFEWGSNLRPTGERRVGYCLSTEKLCNNFWKDKLPLSFLHFWCFEFQLLNLSQLLPKQSKWINSAADNVGKYACSISYRAKITTFFVFVHKPTAIWININNDSKHTVIDDLSIFPFKFLTKVLGLMTLFLKSWLQTIISIKCYLWCTNVLVGH